MSNIEVAPERLEILLRIKQHFPLWEGKCVDWLVEIAELDCGQTCPIELISAMRSIAGRDLPEDHLKTVAWGYLCDLRRMKKAKAKKRAEYGGPQMSLFHPEAFDVG